MKSQYFTIVDGDWFEPGDSFRIVCCDCGLAHDMEFNSVVTSDGLPLEIRMVRNKRSTANVRRHMRGWKTVGRK
jgi:hypothetical protein